MFSRFPVYPLVAFLALLAALVVALDFNLPGHLANNPHAIARVNGTTIPMAEYVRAIDAMQAGLERPLTQQDKSRAVSILINEELIVQEALRLNLASDDRLVRKNLIQALIGSVTAEVPQDTPEQTLRDYFANEKSYFAQPVHVSVKALRTTPRSDVNAFTSALENGATFAHAGKVAALAEVQVAAQIPLAKLGEALGGAARDAVLAMAPGDIAGPVESTDGDVYIWLLSRDGAEPSFAEVRDSVAAQWLKRQEEIALERYLERLRKRARIERYAGEGLMSQ